MTIATGKKYVLALVAACLDDCNVTLRAWRELSSLMAVNGFFPM